MTDFSSQSVTLAIAEQARFYTDMARRFHAHALNSPGHAERLRGDAWFCIRKAQEAREAMYEECEEEVAA